MKNLLLLLFIPFLVFTSCSKDEEDNNTKLLTVWKQDIGDKTYWFRFYNKSTVTYTEAAKGDDYSNSLGESFRYSDENNTITIYKNLSILDNTVWLSGKISNNIMYLNSENESFELIKYNPK